MGIAQDLVQKQQKLQLDRSNFENLWSEVAPLVFPSRDNFFNKHQTQGEKRGRSRYDDTATIALDHSAAVIESVVAPRQSLWHGIDLPEEIDDDQEAMEWADSVRNFLFEKRYSSSSNFASQLHECFLNLLAFGTCVMVVEDMLDGTIRYKAGHLKEFFLSENNRGVIDEVYRLYELTARQAKEKFGDKTPSKVNKALDKSPNQKFEFLHVVIPDRDNETPSEFISYHVLPDGNELIETGAFHSMPYIASRWTTGPNELYGRGPAISILSEIKMLNSQRKTDAKARHMSVSPPILAADQRTIRRLTLKPEAVNYGTLDDNGNPLVRPYQTGADIGASNDGINTSREFINRAFFLNLFQILVDAPAMTATEVLERAQEKGQLLTPTAGRQMSELLDPLINREISIWETYGVFEDEGILAMPDAVKDQGGVFEIEYTNPLTRLQLAEEALGVERTIQSLLPLAQFDETILTRIDFKEYGDIIRDANGAPARMFRSDEEMQEIMEAKAQQAQMQQMIEAAPQVAGSIKDIATAQSLQDG